MRVFRGFDDLPTFEGAVVTLGSFDGLHKGHIALLERLCTEAKQSGGESVVLTFAIHPRVVLGRVEDLRLLTSLEEKIMLLERMGIDNLIIMSFDKQFSRLSYDDFVRQYLVDKIGVKRLVVGYNHHFGRGSEGNYDVAVQLGEECGFEVVRVDEMLCDGDTHVSSTVVRRKVESGDMIGAEQMLSRPYIVVGQVDGDGRLWLSESLKMIPAVGEYRVMIDGVESSVVVDDNGVVRCSAGVCEGRIVVEFLEKIG